MTTLREIIEYCYETRWRYQKDGERSRERALRVVSDVAPENTRDLTRNHLLGWSEWFQNGGHAPKTINRHLAALSCALKTAYDDGLIDHPGPRIPRLPEGEGRERVPTRDEVARVLRELRWPKDRFGVDTTTGSWKTCARLARFLYRTGMRLGEALSLRWFDLTPQTGISQGFLALLEETKSGVPRGVPVPAACRGWFTGPRYHGAEAVFPIPKSTFSAAWRAARERAGIGDWFVPHTLRHARATELIRAGTPFAVVAKILGHRDIRTTMKYTHPSPEDCREAIETRTRA
jgi:integrase